MLISQEMARACEFSAKQCAMIARVIRSCQLTSDEDREDLLHEIISARICGGTDLRIAIAVGTRSFFNKFRGLRKSRKLEERARPVTKKTNVISFADLLDTLIPANPNDHANAKLLKTTTNGRLFYWHAHEIAELFGMREKSVKHARVVGHGFTAWTDEEKVWPTKKAAIKDIGRVRAKELAPIKIEWAV